MTGHTWLDVIISVITALQRVPPGLSGRVAIGWPGTDDGFAALQGLVQPIRHNPE